MQPKEVKESDYLAKPVENLSMRDFLWLTLKKILKKNKWYLLPLWLLLVVIAIFLLIGGHGYLMPAIYLAF